MLSEKRSSPHVVIADVGQLAGVGPEEMRGWVTAQARAGRVDVALGDPSLATERQLSYAIQIRGRPHLYMMVNREVAA
ncbi:MAG: hypothetical protein A2Y74_05380 [Actinobacteria bacterium RBG_13_63_9]|nr:MAG: hypothetical protein A2Y74_05380 [Actinobacteria bacterium RBG_13_63_9]